MGLDGDGSDGSDWRGEINGIRMGWEEDFGGNLAQVCQLQPFVPSNSSNLTNKSLKLYILERSKLDAVLFEGIGIGTDSGGVCMWFAKVLLCGLAKVLLVPN